MKKLLFFVFIILFGKFSFSQSEIDNIIQNKTEEGFVEYFKKNGVSEIEGLYLLNGSPIKFTYYSDLAKVAIVKSGNKFYEYLLKDNISGDFKNLVGKIIRTYTFDSIARKSKTFDKPKIYKRFRFSGGPYSVFDNINNKPIPNRWLVVDRRDANSCCKNNNDADWCSKDCDGTEILKFVYDSGRGTTRAVSRFGSKFKESEHLILFPSNFYLTKKDLDIPYYDFDLDEYYYEYANEMRAMPQYNSVSRTDITGSGYYKYFVITALGEFFTAQKILWLNKENKVVFIEEFHSDDYGKIDQVWDKTVSQYINKYNVNKKWSDETLMFPTKHLYRSYDKLFQFEDLTYKDTPSTVYVGYTTEGSTRYGYRGYVPVRKTYSESEIKLNKQFGSGVSIGKGFMESFKGNKYGLMRALGKEKYENKLKSFDNNVGYSMLFLVQDKESPTEYVNSFNNLIGFMYPSLLKSKTSETKVTFTSLDEGVIAIAAGMNKNCESHLLVDIEKWNNSTFEERLFIVFHELGHDLFNLTHSDGVRLMATNKFNVVSNEELGDMIQEMFFYVLNYKDKSTYDCN